MIKLDLSKYQNSPFSVSENTSKIDISKVFADRSECYINEYALYISHFNSIPNCIHEIEIDCKKASIWFIESFSSEIKDFYFNKRYFNNSKKAEMDDLFCFIYEDLLIDFDTNCSIVRFLFRKTSVDKIEQLIDKLRVFKKRNRKYKPEISLLFSNSKGIGIKSLQITRPKLKIEDNYNEDFKIIHETILSRLSKKNDKGLVLLHGKPGF